MFRLVPLILLIVTLAGASAASVMHGINEESNHGNHHAETTLGDVVADAERALADCCDAAGGMGSLSCFADFVAAAAMALIDPPVATNNSPAHAGSNFPDRALAVPTGPPKV
ncbi:hypothetical protein [uncultured Tateyamaria sp.]|uniref:hypothetical protein n=1 Tax=uncultured Tateyamaria sp. TaxID=455651 RepID=UPI00261B4153|nr:hypothetical protein [uncultured Tateyamaria sp.]